MNWSEVLDTIEVATEPSKMSKRDALEALESLIGEIQMRCDALREEMGEAEE